MKRVMMIIHGDREHSAADKARAPSIEDAIDLAQRNPAAHWGRVEVRPVHGFGGPILGEE